MAIYDHDYFNPYQCNISYIQCLSYMMIQCKSTPMQKFYEILLYLGIV